MVSGAGHHGRLSPTVSSRPAPEGVGQCVGEGNHRCGHGHPPGHARLEDRSEPLFRRNTVMRHQPANIRVTTPSTNGHTPPPQGPTPTTEAPPHNQCRAAPHHAHLTAHTPISVRSVRALRSAPVARSPSALVAPGPSGRTSGHVTHGSAAAAAVTGGDPAGPPGRTGPLPAPACGTGFGPGHPDAQRGRGPQSLRAPGKPQGEGDGPRYRKWADLGTGTERTSAPELSGPRHRN